MADLEERTVEVHIPSLSEDANHRLTESVRAALGVDVVHVPPDRARVSEGERPPGKLIDRVSVTQAMTIGVVAVGVCVGLVIVLTGDSWWLTALAFVVLAIALTIVTFAIMGLASTTDFPDPTLAALLSEQGVRDPDVLFSELVHEFTPPPRAGDRTTDVDEDPAGAIAEQRGAVTPAGGPSEAVGPQS